MFGHFTTLCMKGLIRTLHQLQILWNYSTSSFIQISPMIKCKILVKDFYSHPSIKIQDKFKLNKKFSFQCVSEATLRKVVKNVPSDKAGAGWRDSSERTEK